jgi:xylan 1,4-beta-xylosidase
MMYSSYTAASFARKWQLARRLGVNLDGALTWAFTFEDQPLFAGFRQLATGGIDLPVLNVFRMFSQMSGQQLTLRSDAAVSIDDIKRTGVRDRPDVSAIATLDQSKLAVLLWHYHDDDVPGPEANVKLTVTGIPFKGQAQLTRFAIDAEHSNAFTAWQKIGSPQNPTPQQYSQLKKAGTLAQSGEPYTVVIERGICRLQVPLARQAVVLLTIVAQ